MGKMIIEFHVTAQSIIQQGYIDIASGSEGYLYAKFTYSEEWDDLLKMYRFTHPSKNIPYTNISLPDETVKIPQEVIKPPYFNLAVGGYSETEFVPTMTAKIRVTENGYGERLTQDDKPTEAVLVQMLEAVKESREAATAAQEALSEIEANEAERQENEKERQAELLDMMEVKDEIIQTEAEADAKESERQRNEKERQQAEDLRTSGEDRRIFEEDLRAEAEAERVAAESSRVEKEEERKTEFETMKDNSVPKIGANGNWNTYSISSKKYIDTGYPSRGIQGAQGIRGERGPQGVQGIQGAKGDKGDKGDTGARGEKGEKGDKPIRGTDYWTEEDKAAICADFDEKISEKADQSYVDTVETELDLHAKQIYALQYEDGNIRSEMYAYKQEILASTDESLEDLKSKSIPHTTASADGGMLTITDSLAGEELRDLYIGNVGLPVLTPFKISITGKNLIPVDKYVKEQISASGITWKTNTDGTITANGTTTAQSTYKFLSGAVNTCLPPGTYRISGCPEGGGYGKYRIEYAFGSTGSGYDISNPNDFGSGVIVNAPNGIKNIYAKIIINSGVTCDNLTFKPQLEIGSVKTEFEPAKKNTVTVTSDYPLGFFHLKENKMIYQNEEIEALTDGTLVTVDDEVNNIFVETENVDYEVNLTLRAEYYQDINKVIAELKNAVLAQGADV